MDATTILAAVVCLLVGLVAGSLLTRALSPGEKKRRQLEEKFQAKEEELKTYQRDVSDHLLKTSELVREMNRSQREISEQLATSAMRLASPTVSRQVQDSAFSGLVSDNRTRILSSVPQEAPKDYAPSVPGGILNETYGLVDIEDTSTFNGLGGGADITTEDSSDGDDDPTHKVT